MRRAMGAVALTLALAGAACSDRDEHVSSVRRADGDAASSGSPSTTVAASASEGGALVADRPLPDIGTKVVRTADLRVEVEKGHFAERFREASSLARPLGGFVQASTTSSFEEGNGSGDITLRVPVDRFDEAMARLGKLGKLESTSEQGEDVTDQLVDLGARIRSLRAEEDALNALMSEAQNVNEVLSIRSSSVGIREQIEQLAAQEKSLTDRSSFSTIHVLLHESTASIAETSPTDGWGLRRAVRTSIDAAEAIVGSMIVAVGLLLPLSPFALLALYVVRRRRVVPTEG